jgi:hypothetical protein
MASAQATERMVDTKLANPSSVGMMAKAQQLLQENTQTSCLPTQKPLKRSAFLVVCGTIQWGPAREHTP